MRDTERAFAAARSIFDGRDPKSDFGGVMVTLEHVVAVVLLALLSSPERAAGMLNEGLVQGVESRLALYASKRGGSAGEASS